MNIEKTKSLISDKSVPEPNTGCWIWLGSLSNGYGIITIDCANYLAHRLSFEAFKQKPTKLVRHSCNNSWCVSPEHLVEGTHKDNAQDRVRMIRAFRRLKDPAYQWWLP